MSKSSTSRIFQRSVPPTMAASSSQLIPQWVLLTRTTLRTRSGAQFWPQDDAAIAAIELGSGPVWLLVQRFETGVDVRRINEKEWQFAAQLCAGRPLQAALDATPGFDAATALAGYLAAGRFTGFKLEPA